MQCWAQVTRHVLLDLQQVVKLIGGLGIRQIVAFASACQSSRNMWNVSRSVELATRLLAASQAAAFSIALV